MEINEQAKAPPVACVTLSDLVSLLSSSLFLSTSGLHSCTSSDLIGRFPTQDICNCAFSNLGTCSPNNWLAPSLPSFNVTYHLVSEARRNSILCTGFAPDPNVVLPIHGFIWECEERKQVKLEVNGIAPSLETTC